MALEKQKMIGNFLRRKREGLDPEQLGLVRPRRTRTPGLRREDVAALAGISAVWYGKIERGQAAGISRDALLALARVLRLKPAEHHYLMTLARHVMADSTEIRTSIDADTHALMSKLDPLPAIVMNEYFDILAINHAYRVMCGMDLEGIAWEQRNYLSLIFRSDDWRRFIVAEDPGSRKRSLERMVGTLRGISANHPNNEVMKSRIAQFRGQSMEFCEIWDNEVVSTLEENILTFNHAVLGRILLRKQIWINFSGESMCRMNIFNPVEEETRQRLASL